MVGLSTLVKKICDNLVTDILRHAVTECASTNHMREFFFESIVSLDLINRDFLLLNDDAEFFIQTLLGRPCDDIHEESWNLFLSYAFLFIKECMDFYQSATM